MALNDETMRNLALRLAQYAAGAAPASPARPRLILPAHARDPDALDEHTRARHERRIQFIVGRYGLQWMVDQHGDGPISGFSDAALLALLAKCERALKAVMEGVSFDDAGLVQWSD